MPRFSSWRAQCSPDEPDEKKATELVAVALLCWFLDQQILGGIQAILQGGWKKMSPRARWVAMERLVQAPPIHDWLGASIHVWVQSFPEETQESSRTQDRPPAYKLTTNEIHALKIHNFIMNHLLNFELINSGYRPPLNRIQWASISGAFLPPRTRLNFELIIFNAWILLTNSFSLQTG